MDEQPQGAIAPTAVETAGAEPQNAIVRTPPADEAPAAAAPAAAADPDGVELDLDKFNELKVRLGGRLFVAREPSLKTQKDVIRQSTESGDGESDVDAEDTDAVQAIKTLRDLDLIYPQIEEVLVHLDGDEQGSPPSREFVEEHLRISSMAKLFTALRGAEGNDSDG